MKKREYPIKDFDGMSVVYEMKRQKDILEILDEFLDNADYYGWDETFEDVSFTIEYSDGTTYEANSLGEFGRYTKKGISRILYVNANDTQVYGDYTVNEYGNVA